MLRVQGLQPRQTHRRGAATVEFALTAPLLFLIVFGMIEVGQGVLIKQVLSNAARDGARTAMLGNATAQDVRDAVTSYLTASGIKSATATVSPDPLTLAQGGDPVTVTVSVPFSSLSWMQKSWYLNDITISSAVTMRREVFITSPD